MKLLQNVNINISPLSAIAF